MLTTDLVARRDTDVEPPRLVRLVVESSSMDGVEAVWLTSGSSRSLAAALLAAADRCEELRLVG